MTDAEPPQSPMEQGSIDIMERLIEIAHPNAVFGEAVIVGDTVVITAAEVSLGLGFGFGGGDSTTVATDDDPAHNGRGVGGGGGGGGHTRPVAVIVVGPNGVHVKPIIDRTRIAIAALALLGMVAAVIGKRRRDT